MGFWAIWHSGTMSWLSGHLGHLGTSGNLRDVQESSVTSGMTLWHAGTLLACWPNWQTHGTQTNDDHHPLNLVDFRLQAVVVSLQFSGFTGFVMIRWSELEHSETAPSPKTEKYDQKTDIYRTKNELAHKLIDCQNKPE